MARVLLNPNCILGCSDPIGSLVLPQPQPAPPVSLWMGFWLWLATITYLPPSADAIWFDCDLPSDWTEPRPSLLSRLLRKLFR